MPDSDTKGSPAKGKPLRHWLRVVRPLLAWLLLMLVLFGIRIHQQLSEQTSLVFSVDLEGKPTGLGESVTLDGQSVSSGERVSLGSHRLAITHPKAEPVSSNLFIWYGVHNLGAISLQRTRGTVALLVQPPATRLSVRGDEFSLILTNSSGVTASVPTDIYQVEAQWANYELTERVTVAKGSTGSTRLAPPLGDLTLESEPSGATVVARTGRTLGTTPLKLRKIPAGPWTGDLRLDGYIPVSLALVVSAGQTNLVRTNLVNWQYSQAMEVARKSLGMGDDERALEALEAALIAKPGDPDATALQKDARLMGHLRRASEWLAKEGYAAARRETELALGVRPDSSEAKALLADIRRREEQSKRRQDQLLAEQEKKRQQQAMEEQRQARLLPVQQNFDQWMTSSGQINTLFDEQKMVVKETWTNIEARLLQSLTNGQSAFQIMTSEHRDTGIFRLMAKQGLKTEGWRRCQLVGGQTGDDEVTLIFKVFEYAFVEKFSIRAWIGENDESKMIPIHPMRLEPERHQLLRRRDDGIALIRTRIEEATGK